MIKKASEKKTVIQRKDLNAVLERQEKYSKCNCLLVHGVDQVQGEDTDELFRKVIKEYMD